MRLALIAVATLIGLIFVACGGNTNLAQLSSEELFAKGMEKYNDGKYYNASEYFQAIVYSYAGESIVDTAQYYLALSYFGNEDYDLAQVEFNRLVINYPSSVYFENAMLHRAACAYLSTPKHFGLDQSELVQAIKLFEDFIIDFPESAYLPEAKEYLLRARTRMAHKYYESGLVYTRIGASEAARKYYQIVVDDYTDTEYASLAVFGIAKSEYKLRHYSEAHQKFADFAKLYPDHELFGKAEKMKVEAAFKAGQYAYEKADYQQAQEKLSEFIQLYPDSDKAKKANELLNQIQQTAKSEA
jgi:outer membrane protein assembly factor BamD